MLKASALYIVIIISLVIAVICSSLVVAAYFYKNQYQKKFRYDNLENNLSSGLNIILSRPDTGYAGERTFSLFDNDADSVSLNQFNWGIFNIGTVKAFIQKDTLFKVFSLAYRIDSAKWAALYLADEDRPLSLSGNTSIEGDAFIPKAGVIPVYMANKFYNGDKRLIAGIQHSSAKKLPFLQSARLTYLEKFSKPNRQASAALASKDSIKNSFLSETLSFSFGKNVHTLENITLIGNIVLFSDTAIIIDSTAKLDNILVFARSVTVKNGFKGTCQLFASDSVHVGERCRFEYPSCLGIINFNPAGFQAQSTIEIGKNSDFTGIIFTYQKTANAMPSLITVGEHVIISGQVYSQGDLQLKENAAVKGSVFTRHFLYQTTFSSYDDYLVNVKIDAKSLSSYYLTSELTPVASGKRKILQWLEAN